MNDDGHIVLTNVHKAFGAKKVLNGINISVPRGQSLVVIGGSGTGKSVMIKTILGILRADSGSIKVADEEVVGLKGAERDAYLARFGMLFRERRFLILFRFGRMSPSASSRDAGWPPQGTGDRVRKAGPGGAWPEVGGLYPAELSGGMQKRVGLARAIAADPEIIFFDEPTTGLDPIMADVINNLIVDSVRRLGATTISITHDMASARKIADRIAMIHKGEIIWQGRLTPSIPAATPM